ncbi:NAD(P)/FAD-dependent oxidoreductase [Allomesorhizobium camelthorni]|uniref:Thioredoxin reductase n=1 Tax=Allomesorhizobium camelthorni TaxID=475069 RepID=A0A6G4WEK0_9HYPH|nr:NAD(P)/FAD-dependent oxidoreductase [Mesorhizobium camelthorni]NGO52560.1 NAD(P)/FAD-dependent oxidoreductase [Mesorhizobium camelthorni]
MQYDLIVVGGSFAGLSAATQVARARRRVLVIDGGQPRNRFAAHSHGFLGQDGRTPADILGDARKQLLAYPTAIIVDAYAAKAEAAGDGFAVALEDGKTFEGARLLLATGVRDTLPDIPGLQEQWGKTVLHCPYCHGYEAAGGPLGVLAVGAISMHQALLIPDWGDVTLFTNAAFEPDAEQMRALDGRGVKLEPARIAACEAVGADGLVVRLEDGRAVRVKALFTAPRTSMASPLAEQLGCAFAEGGLGPIVKVDELQQTSVPGVYAAGDAARSMTNIAFAVADGAFAGVAAHRSLIWDSF